MAFRWESKTEELQAPGLAFPIKITEFLYNKSEEIGWVVSMVGFQIACAYQAQQCM